MKKIITYTITHSDSNQTIEHFLRTNGYSRHLIVHLRKTPGGICIGEAPAYTTHRLATGELLTISIEEEISSPGITATVMDLDIIYEDEDILIINKQANVPIHPSQGNYDNTLANGITAYYEQKGEPFVYRVINRLDRDTTGLLIIAKHMLSACILSAMVRERKIHREYLAAASGLVPEEGTITAPIARSEGSTIERCVDEARGEYACTHYRRLSYHEGTDCSLVALRLETGRTHQIRVHMRHMGHPLPGDFLYNPDFRLISRQALHSFRLAFSHPLTGEAMEFQAPLPEDIRRIIKMPAQPAP